MSPGPITAAADPARMIPAVAAARLDHARAALDSLRNEQRRLERLGLEVALARCGAAVRYWQFVTAILTVAQQANTSRPVSR